MTCPSCGKEFIKSHGRPTPRTSFGKVRIVEPICCSDGCVGELVHRIVGGHYAGDIRDALGMWLADFVQGKEPGLLEIVVSIKQKGVDF